MDINYFALVRKYAFHFADFLKVLINITWKMSCAKFPPQYDRYKKKLFDALN
jgi:hypothetical protein